MPVLSIALQNEHRLDMGQSSTLRQSQNRMTRPMSMISSIPSLSMQKSLPKSTNPSQNSQSQIQTGNVSLDKEKEYPESSTSSLNGMVSVMSIGRGASKRPGLNPIKENDSPPKTAQTLGEYGGDVVGPPPRSPSDTFVQSMSVMEMAIPEWSKFSVEETRDLLSCVLFVLKNIRQGVYVLYIRTYVCTVSLSMQ